MFHCRFAVFGVVAFEIRLLLSFDALLPGLGPFRRLRVPSASAVLVVGATRGSCLPLLIAWLGAL